MDAECLEEFGLKTGHRKRLMKVGAGGPSNDKTTPGLSVNLQALRQLQRDDKNAAVPASADHVSKLFVAKTALLLVHSCIALVHVNVEVEGEGSGLAQSVPRTNECPRCTAVVAPPDLPFCYACGLIFDG